MPRVIFYVCSVDPGVRNFAYVIGRVDADALGPAPTPASVFDALEVVSVAKVDLQRARDHGSLVRACRALVRVLDADPFFARVSFVVIEAQRGANPACVKIAQHVLSFTLARVPDAGVHSMAPRAKLGAFGGPIGGTASARKRFSVQTLEAYLAARPHGAFAPLRACLAAASKKDDVADAVLQLCTFLLLGKWGVR